MSETAVGRRGLRRPSLRRRVALTTTLLVVGTAGLLGWLNVAQQRTAYRQLIHTAAETIGSTVAGELSRTVEAGGDVDLLGLIDTFAAEDGVESFTILPPMMATADDERRAVDLRDPSTFDDIRAELLRFDDEDRPFIRQAVAIDGTLLGVVQVVLDIDLFLAQAADARDRTTLMTFGVAGLALLSGYLVLRRPMRELDELSTAMEASGAEELREMVRDVEDPVALEEPLADLPAVDTPEVRRLRDAFDAHRVAVRTLAGELAHRLSASDNRFRTAFQQSPVGLALVDDDGWILQVNTALGALLGVAPEDLAGRRLAAFHDPAEQGEDGPAAEGERRYRSVTGEGVEVVQSAARLDSDLWVVQLQDVTADRRAERALHDLAFTDQLTGLANRVSLDQHLEGALAEGPVAVLMVDLDRFKLVNDSLGHVAGDRMLAAVADRLRRAVEQGFVTRFGGDEFVVVVPAPDEPALAVHIEQVRRVVNAPIELDGRQVFLTASIGVGLSEPGISTGDLIARADAAAYTAKAEGRGQVHRYQPEMRRAAEQRLFVEADLRAAIGSDQISVVFQPITSMHDCSVVLLEALVRWTHPTVGPISPGEFIPVAEETGLIDSLGAQVVGLVCTAVAPLMAEGLGGTRWRVSINTSGVELRDQGYVSRFLGQVAAAGIPVERVVLEVTESVLVEEQAVATLTALRARGVRLAADDFGRGMSSIAQLMRFPLDVLKVDMSLLHAARLGSGSGEGVLQSVALLGRALGAMVVAEGVESARDADLVASAGCDAGQGWHLGRPVARDALAEVLDRLDPAQAMPGRGPLDG